MISTQPYRICTRCIMDTSDPGIEFDAAGVCNRCRAYEVVCRRYMPSPETRDQALRELVASVKADGRNKPYDCVIGVSGGVDSTYLAYQAKTLGLRPLAVHLDNGWDSELAVSNIEHCLKTLEIDLYTEVLDWDEFRDLQLAFLKASTPDSEIPTDHAIVSLMMKKAAELGVRHVLIGVNTATEGVFSPAWSSGHSDWRYIRGVHRQFGAAGKLRQYPHMSLLDIAWLRFVRKIQLISFLNYFEYEKHAAVELLQREVGWKPYTGKHHESIYTRFFQCYILPRKFGYDKRRMHLSALVMSGQIARAQALQEMQEPACAPELLRLDKIYVCKKLGLTEAEFEAIMAMPCKTIGDYPCNDTLLAVRLLRWWQKNMPRFAPHLYGCEEA